MAGKPSVIFAFIIQGTFLGVCKMIAFWVFVKIPHSVIEICDFIYVYMLFYFSYIYTHTLFNKCLNKICKSVYSMPF